MAVKPSSLIVKLLRLRLAISDIATGSTGSITTDSVPPFSKNLLTALPISPMSAASRPAPEKREAPTEAILICYLTVSGDVPCICAARLRPLSTIDLSSSRIWRPLSVIVCMAALISLPPAPSFSKAFRSFMPEAE